MLHKLCIYSFVAFFVPTACKQKTDADFHMTRGTVLSGNESFRSSFVTLRLVLEKQELASCSGVRVGPRHVLTAAHCLENVKSVEVATFDEKMQRTTWKVAAWKVHPRWSEFKNETGVAGIASDLAILVLNQSTPFAYAKIDSSRRQQMVELKYVGTGRIEGERSDGKPRYAQDISAVLKTQPGVGGAWYSKAASLICDGDSGGPLLTQRGELLGIASGVGLFKNAKDFCGAGEVVYHADVRSNLNWIACTYKGWGVPLPGYEKPDCR